MSFYTLSALVIIVLTIIAFGMRVLRRLRTNTTPTSYKIFLVFFFFLLIAGVVWAFFQLHIL